MRKKNIDQLPPVTDELRKRARELRDSMTDAERRLWRRIRSRQLGAFFHRQRVVGSYICDFVSLDGGMVVEVDGSGHYQDESRRYDSKRDEYLKSLGFDVLRFSNTDVVDNIGGVLEVIQEKLR